MIVLSQEKRTVPQSLIKIDIYDASCVLLFRESMKGRPAEAGGAKHLLIVHKPNNQANKRHTYLGLLPSLSYKNVPDISTDVLSPTAEYYPNSISHILNNIFTGRNSRYRPLRVVEPRTNRAVEFPPDIFHVSQNLLRVQVDRLLESYNTKLLLCHVLYWGRRFLVLVTRMLQSRVPRRHSCFFACVQLLNGDFSLFFSTPKSSHPFGSCRVFLGSQCFLYVSIWTKKSSVQSGDVH